MKEWQITRTFYVAAKTKKEALEKLQELREMDLDYRFCVKETVSRIKDDESNIVFVFLRELWGQLTGK